MGGSFGDVESELERDMMDVLGLDSDEGGIHQGEVDVGPSNNDDESSSMSSLHSFSYPPPPKKTYQKKKEEEKPWRRRRMREGCLPRIV